MNQKQIGVVLIIIGVLLASFIYMSKEREDTYIKMAINNNAGSCMLDDGTCLHVDRSWVLYIFGGILSAALIILGLYLYFFDKTQKILTEHQIKVTSALTEAKKVEREKDEFKAFLSGFNLGEQKILSSIKEQEGIKQSTLRFKTGMSKTALSLVLKDLEHRDIIKRKPSGKTNEVYLRKKF